MPASIVDMKLRQAQEIIEELLKPVVRIYTCLFVMLPTIIIVVVQPYSKKEIDMNGRYMFENQVACFI